MAVRIATLLALLALAVPSAALAQGAGDEQYSDPFGNEQNEQPEPEPAPAPAPEDPAPVPAPETGEPAAPPAAAPAQAQPEQLPYTGADAGLLALGGALLLAGGVALRVRPRDQR